jgi:hypothetical protein
MVRAKASLGQLPDVNRPLLVHNGRATRLTFAPIPLLEDLRRCRFGWRE